MDNTNTPFYHTYNAILDQIRYRTGFNGKHTVEQQQNHFKYSNGKREYSGLLSNTDNCIHLGIKEDGSTRTVFNGVIYTIEQFFTVDSLTQIH